MTPSHATNTTTIHAVEHLCPGRCLTTTSNFSSKLALLITHLAKGHPDVVLPSLPVYMIYKKLADKSIPINFQLFRQKLQKFKNTTVKLPTDSLIIVHKVLSLYLFYNKSFTAKWLLIIWMISFIFKCEKLRFALNIKMKC